MEEYGGCASCFKPVYKKSDVNADDVLKYPDMFYKGAKPRQPYGALKNDVFEHDSAEDLVSRLETWETRILALQSTYGVIGTLLLGIAVTIYMDTTSQNEPHHLDDFVTWRGEDLFNDSEDEGEAKDASVKLFHMIKIVAAAMIGSSGITSMMSTICVIQVVRAPDRIAAHRFFDVLRVPCLGTVSEFYNRINAITMFASILLLFAIITMDSLMRMDWKATYYWPVIALTAGTSLMVIVLWWFLEVRFNRCYEETMVHREWREKKADDERVAVTAAAAASVSGRETKHIRDLELRLGRLRNGRKETTDSTRRPDEKSDFAYGTDEKATYWN